MWGVKWKTGDGLGEKRLGTGKLSNTVWIQPCEMLSPLNSVPGRWEWNIWLGDWFYSLYLKGVRTASDSAADWCQMASRASVTSLSQGQSVGINFSDSSLGSKIAARWGAECIQGRKSFWRVPPESKVRTSMYNWASQAGVGKEAPINMRGKWEASLHYKHKRCKIGEEILILFYRLSTWL